MKIVKPENSTIINLKTQALSVKRFQRPNTIELFLFLNEEFQLAL